MVSLLAAYTIPPKKEKISVLFKSAPSMSVYIFLLKTGKHWYFTLGIVPVSDAYWKPMLHGCFPICAGYIVDLQYLKRCHYLLILVHSQNVSLQMKFLWFMGGLFQFKLVPRNEDKDLKTLLMKHGSQLSSSLFFSKWGNNRL